MQGNTHILFLEINKSYFTFSVGVNDEQNNIKIIHKIDVPLIGIENNRISDFEKVLHVIKENIYLIEQNINHTFKEIVLILENFKPSFINLTGYKKLNGSQILRENITYIINTLKSYNLTGFTINDETGVWVKDNNGLSKKICAFGIRASRWVTMHGLCFNVNPDLTYFNHIIPCGIKNKGITSLQELKKEDIDIDEVKLRLVKNFKLVFNAEINFEVS